MGFVDDNQQVEGKSLTGTNFQYHLEGDCAQEAGKGVWEQERNVSRARYQAILQNAPNPQTLSYYGMTWTEMYETYPDTKNPSTKLKPSHGVLL